MTVPTSRPVSALLPIVYALQFREHQDFQKAEAFGEVVFLSRLEVNPGQPKSLIRLERELEHGLRNYRPGIDLILPTGSQPAQILLGRVLEHLFSRETRHTVLYWQPRRETYAVVAV